MIPILLYLTLFAGISSLHPVHISVSNVEIDGSSIEMTLRTFRDDLQVAYFHYNSKPIDYSSTDQLKTAWLSSYLTGNLLMVAQPSNDTVFLKYFEVRIEEDAVVFELQGRLPDQANSLYIYNGFLLDIYSDQSNLMIFGIAGKEHGMKFDAGHKEQVLKLRH